MSHASSCSPFRHQFQQQMRDCVDKSTSDGDRRKDNENARGSSRHDASRRDFCLASPSAIDNDFG